MKKIYVASDHAGFALKEFLLKHLQQDGHDIEDLGPHTLDPLDDYPDYIIPLAKKVAQEKDRIGIVIGASGEGEAVAANRVPGARAAVYYGGSLDILRLSREHNDCNILSLAARFLSPEEALAATRIWLETAFSGAERHLRRIAKLDHG